MEHSTSMGISTRRHALAQLLICKGCCCGRVDRGKPFLPEERLRRVWKAEHLNPTIQLTISGCLGPCDAPNVVQLTTSDHTEFLGGLVEADYDDLIEWARACRHADRLLSLPAPLVAHRLTGFLDPPLPHV